LYVKNGHGNDCLSPKFLTLQMKMLTDHA